jgi:hypothetical protein
MPKHNGREITDRREAAEIMLELLAKKYRNRARKASQGKTEPEKPLQ